MMERSDRAVLLADRSKFELVQFERVCALADIDDFVTDATPPKRLAASINHARVRMIVAAQA
jgi:DeoR/GlpR family transcriptional regulator of sugar metabolism